MLATVIPCITAAVTAKIIIAAGPAAALAPMAPEAVPAAGRVATVIVPLAVAAEIDVKLNPANGITAESVPNVIVEPIAAAAAAPMPAAAMPAPAAMPVVVCVETACASLVVKSP